MKKIKQLANKINIPGAISLLSLLSAWTAILLLLSNELRLSVVMAVIAFLLDAADGLAARKLELESEFGRQLDSFIDIINYSLLSALVIWKEIIPGALGAIVGFIVIITGILRLAAFNQEGCITKKGITYYRGLIVCHMSLIAFIFLLISRFVQLPEILIALFISLFALLQLSDIKTRKSGALLFWAPVAILIGIVGFLWL